jgi:hypothetical protein
MPRVKEPGQSCLGQARIAYGEGWMPVENNKHFGFWAGKTAPSV